MNYEEIKNRLMEDLEVRSYRLVERNKTRNATVAQNGPDGLVYLADIKYWKLSFDADKTLCMENGDYAIYPESMVEVYHNDKLVANCESVKEALNFVIQDFIK